MTQVDPITIRSIIRRKLDAGLLVRHRPEMTLAGVGDGSPCAVCEMPIGTEQIEWSFVSKNVVTDRFHPTCHRLWEAECRRRGWRTS